MGVVERHESEHSRFGGIREPAISFINSLAEFLAPQDSSSRTLLLNRFEFIPDAPLAPWFGRGPSGTEEEAPDGDLKESLVGKVDVLLGLFPFSAKTSSNSRLDSSAQEMIASLPFLASGGTGMFMLPSVWSTLQKDQVTEALMTSGCSVIAVVNAPPGFLLPATNIRPVFALIGKKDSEKTFFLDTREYSDLILGLDFLGSPADSDDIFSGIWMNLEDFPGFTAWHLARELDSVGGDYTTYEKYTLSDVAIAMATCEPGASFEPDGRAIYVPTLGNSPVLLDPSAGPAKPHVYVQVIVDDNLASPEFLVNFLNSHYGKALRAYVSESSASGLPRLTPLSVRALQIALPPLDTQRAICSSIAKLAQLRHLVAEIEENMSVNPISSKESLRQIDDVLDAMGKLSLEDHLLEVIRRGESKVTEFKQTLRMDIKDGSAQKYIETAVLKTVAAFLNSDGGYLIVGVKDDGQILGIQEEIDKIFKGSTDRFLLHFKTMIKAHLGEQLYPLIDQNIVEVQGVKLLHVRCQRSDVEVYVDQMEFYVRTNPATDRLEGPKLVAYVRQRFGSPSGI